MRPDYRFALQRQFIEDRFLYITKEAFYPKQAM
jgi:hypothetical protein